IGLRAVRSIAISISRSIELSVPSTICNTIGSTGFCTSFGATGQGLVAWLIAETPHPLAAARDLSSKGRGELRAHQLNLSPCGRGRPRQRPGEGASSRFSSHHL